MAKGIRFVRYMPYVLEALKSKGGSASPAEVYQYVATASKATDSELTATNKDGTSNFENAVAWSRFYLAAGGLIDKSKRGIWSLTQKGHSCTLDQQSAPVLYKQIRAGMALEQLAKRQAGGTTSGNLEEGDYRQQVAAKLLSLSPVAFEHFAQRLLREAGFVEVEVTGKSGDGGIDGKGLLTINPLVTQRVLFQCKRHKSAVGPADVREFQAACQGRTDKGIFLTTASFTQAARAEARRDGATQIELVDMERIITLLEQLELA